MSSEMVRRVGKAIAAAYNENRIPGTPYDIEVHPVDLAVARAAIKEMWSPTEAMTEAHYEAHARATTVMASAEEVWSAMITAALGGE